MMVAFWMAVLIKSQSLKRFPFSSRSPSLVSRMLSFFSATSRELIENKKLMATKTFSYSQREREKRQGKAWQESLSKFCENFSYLFIQHAPLATDSHLLRRSRVCVFMPYFSSPRCRPVLYEWRKKCIKSHSLCDYYNASQLFHFKISSVDAKGCIVMFTTINISKYSCRKEVFELLHLQLVACLIVNSNSRINFFIPSFSLYSPKLSFNTAYFLFVWINPTVIVRIFLRLFLFAF